MIVGVAGFKGAGKGTVADILVKHGFVKLSLASSLKDIIASLFDWPRDYLEGQSKESRKWREEPLPDWNMLAGSGIFQSDKEITPRLVMQRFGTDLFREQVNESFWIYVLLPKAKKLLKRYKGVVIDDCRFPNELQECDLTIRVIRNGTENSTHVSETSHLDWEYDYVVDNNSSIEELETQVAKIFNIDILRDLSTYFVLGCVESLLRYGEVYGVLTGQENEKDIKPKAVEELDKVRRIIDYVIQHNTIKDLRTTRRIEGKLRYSSVNSIISDINMESPDINDQLHIMFETNGIEFHDKVRY